MHTFKLLFNTRIIFSNDHHRCFAQACDPSNYDKVHRKAKCPVAGCRERLSTINTYRCKDCKANVCLKHRFPSDHHCKPAAGRILADCIYCQCSLSFVAELAMDWLLVAAQVQQTIFPPLQRFWSGRSGSAPVEASKAADRIKAPKSISVKGLKDAPYQNFANSLRDTAFRRQAAAEVC